MKIVWAPLAVDRVFEIAEYIPLDKPSAAKNWIDRVFESVKRVNKGAQYLILIIFRPWLERFGKNRVRRG